MNCKVKYIVINSLRKIKHLYLSLKTISMEIGKKKKRRSNFETLVTFRYTIHPKNLENYKSKI